MKTAQPIEVGQPNPSVPATLEQFQALFNQLEKGNLDRLPHVYCESIRFQDSFGSLQGLDALTRYFASAYANVISCRFVFQEAIVQDSSASIPWVMHLRHKRIRRGQEIRVEGISHVTVCNGKIGYHRDYFDAGQLLYENLPLLGGVIRKVKDYAG